MPLLVEYLVRSFGYEYMRFQRYGVDAFHIRILNIYLIEVSEEMLEVFKI